MHDHVRELTQLNKTIVVCADLSPKALAFVRPQELSINHVCGDYHGVDCLVIKWRGRNHQRNRAQRKTAGDWGETTVYTSHIWKRENEMMYKCLQCISSFK